MGITRYDVIKEYLKEERGIELTDTMTLSRDGNSYDEIAKWVVYSGKKDTGIEIYYEEYFEYLEKKFSIDNSIEKNPIHIYD